MGFLFLLAAVCPALIITGYETGKGNKELSWKTWAAKAAEWFYLITFANLLLLYARGWGTYDFTTVSVQFLLKYMLSSTAVIALVKLVKWAVPAGLRCCGAVERKKH